MVKLCSICGRLYYEQETQCDKCENIMLELIKNMEISCGFGKFKIEGDY